MDLKKAFIDNMEFLAPMDTRERILYRKWYEIHHTNWSNKQLNTAWQVKQMLWKWSGDPDEFKSIDPIVVHANSKQSNDIWTTLRIFCSNAVWNGIPGKIQKFFVIDKHTKKYIGFFALSSDLKDIGGRNNYIGWSKEDRYEGGMLDNIAIGSTIIPTQPFGHNFLGGKLLSLLLCSDPVIQIWEEKYNKPLAGITTSSLYGAGSQYDGLRQYWRKCKSSEGKDILKPTPDVWKLCKEYVLEKYPEKYTGCVYNKKKLSHFGTVVADIRRDFGIPKYINNEPRGVYFNRLYDNTNEFLRREVDELVGRRNQGSLEEMIDLWRGMCHKRVKNLIKKDNFSSSSLFHDDIIKLSWDEWKEKHS